MQETIFKSYLLYLLLHAKGRTKIQQCNKTISKMINYNIVTKENMNKHNLYWPQIPDHPHIILIIGGSGSGKTKTLLNLIK